MIGGSKIVYRNADCSKWHPVAEKPSTGMGRSTYEVGTPWTRDTLSGQIHM